MTASRAMLAQLIKVVPLKGFKSDIDKINEGCAFWKALAAEVLDRDPPVRVACSQIVNPLAWQTASYTDAADNPTRSVTHPGWLGSDEAGWTGTSDCSAHVIEWLQLEVEAAQ